MVRILRNHERWRETLFLGAISVFCVLLSLVRILRTDSIMYVFLNWNLFLAFIPWALSTFTILNPRIQKSKGIVLFILLTWLLFFPNAPYILTDLFHLRAQSSVPIWFDLSLILCFSWAGLLYGLISLRDIETILGKWMSQRWSVLVTTVLLFITAFGIYLGRFLRWNSWDILADPFSLVFDILNRILHPMQHAETWGMTLLFGAFLNVVYWTFRIVTTQNKVY